MSQYTQADAIRVFLTGTIPYPVDPALSLGGAISPVVMDSFTVRRYNPIYGVVVEYVAGENPLGLGALWADTANSLKWTPPSGTAGPSTPIAYGETTMVPGGNASHYLVVRRILASNLAGNETVQLLDTYRSLVGGTDFTSAERTAGASHYRCAGVQNVSAGEVTNLIAWIDVGTSGHTRIALEAPSGGAVQSVADEITAPTGLSFVAPTTQGTALTLAASLSAGDWRGLWIEQFVLALASASARIVTSLRLRYTVSGTDYFGRFRGIHRVADDALQRYELYVTQDGFPLEGDTPADTGDLPLTANVAAAHTYYHVTLQRNRHGLLRWVKDFTSLVVEADGEQGVDIPSAPAEVSAKAGPDGTALLVAVYDPIRDETAATHFLVYSRYDGTNPDPTTDTPYEEAMQAGDGPKYLHWASATQLDGTPGKFLVRTRCTVDALSSDSTNTTPASVTIVYDGPIRPFGAATLGRAAGVRQGPMPYTPITTWIDEGNGVKWVQGVGFTELWGGAGELVFKAYYNAAVPSLSYLSTIYGLSDAGTSGAGTGTAEVLSWTAGDKRIALNVNGTRRLLIDVTNRTLTASAFHDSGAEVSRQPGPAHPKYAHTCIQVWDPSQDDWACAFSMGADGVLSTAVPIVQTDSY